MSEEKFDRGENFERETGVNTIKEV